MANAPKKKGTAGEAEVLHQLFQAGFERSARTPPGWPYDIEVQGKFRTSVDVLATRPDRGRWLVTIPLSSFLDLLGYRGYSARVEVKRFKSFAMHSIFEKKFPWRPR